MSEPDFDPDVEKAFRATPPFVDSALFDAEVAVRLENRWRWRRAILSVLAVIGAAAVLSQFVRIQMQGLIGPGTLARLVEREERSGAMALARDLAGQMGLEDVSVGILGGSQLLILFGVAATIILGSMAFRLSKSL